MKQKWEKSIEEGRKLKKNRLKKNRKVEIGKEKTKEFINHKNENEM